MADEHDEDASATTPAPRNAGRGFGSVPGGTEFSNQVAIVTGAATGNGEAIARKLLREGACVIVVGHDRGGLEALLDELDPARDRSRSFEADVRDESAMACAVAMAQEAFGALHLAVNNAGTPGPAATPLPELSLEDWRAVLDTNVTGMFLGPKFQLPAIAQAGGGAIVNLSSANGVVGLANMAAYTASKHAVVGLTKSAALEFAGQGVRVNCIGPGYVATPRMRQMGPEALEELAKLHPLGRLAEPEEVAELAAFLLSDRARFCTGAFYPLDGGYTAQ